MNPVSTASRLVLPRVRFNLTRAVQALEIIIARGQRDRARYQRDRAHTVLADTLDALDSVRINGTLANVTRFSTAYDNARAVVEDLDTAVVDEATPDTAEPP